MHILEVREPSVVNEENDLARRPITFWRDYEFDWNESFPLVRPPALMQRLQVDRWAPTVAASNNLNIRGLLSQRLNALEIPSEDQTENRQFIVVERPGIELHEPSIADST